MEPVEVLALLGVSTNFSRDVSSAALMNINRDGNSVVEPPITGSPLGNYSTSSANQEYQNLVRLMIMLAMRIFAHTAQPVYCRNAVPVFESMVASRSTWYEC